MVWETKKVVCPVQSLTGQLQHAATVIRPGHTFIRRLYDLLSISQAHIWLNKEARSDLVWWFTFLCQWNGLNATHFEGVQSLFTICLISVYRKWEPVHVIFFDNNELCPIAAILEYYSCKRDRFWSSVSADG